MRRLILEQPTEPLKWLIKEITDKPYPTPEPSGEAKASEEPAVTEPAVTEPAVTEPAVTEAAA